MIIAKQSVVHLESTETVNLGDYVKSSFCQFEDNNICTHTHKHTPQTHMLY